MIYELGLPRKLCESKEQAIKFVNKYNGIRGIYRTVYNFHFAENHKPNYNSAIIHKLFFDFDDDNSWTEANKLHQHCLKQNIKHYLIMSGRGYHVFVICDSYNPNNSKSLIYNSQHHFIDKLGLICDPQIIGDNARLHRIPNTYNIKAKRYCIPLTQKQFELGDIKIKELAAKQNFVKNIIIGENDFDIRQFDYQSERFNENVMFDQSEFEDSFGNLDYVRGCPNCIKNILMQKDAGWKERYLLILYYKEMGYTKNEVGKILKQTLSEKKFKHCIGDEHQLQYLYERDDLIFPNCETIAMDQLCPGKCDKHNSVIYK